MMDGELAGVSARAQSESAEPAVVYHVAQSGSDAWSGTLPAPNATRTDAPLATLNWARDAVRAIKKAQEGVLRRPVTIQVHDGTYPLAQPWVLGPDDSGTPGCPVTYTAAAGERPVLSGGRPVTGWEETTVAGSKRSCSCNGRRCGCRSRPSIYTP